MLAARGAAQPRCLRRLTDTILTEAPELRFKLPLLLIILGLQSQSSGAVDAVCLSSLTETGAALVLLERSWPSSRARTPQLPAPPSPMLAAKRRFAAQCRELYAAHMGCVRSAAPSPRGQWILCPWDRIRPTARHSPCPWSSFWPPSRPPVMRLLCSESYSVLRASAGSHARASSRARAQALSRVPRSLT